MFTYNSCSCRILTISCDYVVFSIEMYKNHCHTTYFEYFLIYGHHPYRTRNLKSN